MRTFPIVLGGLLFLDCAANAASGLYQDGIGARSMSLGGADVGYATGPLSAFGINPAAAGELTAPTLDVGAVAVIPNGRFDNSVNSDAHLYNSIGAIGEGAFGMRLGNSKFGVVIGIVPDAALSADWKYFDTPGGADGSTTYGFQTHKSEILALRSGIAVGWQINPKLSIGAGVGVIYNENTLRVPYVFQTQPALKGVKTLLDLETSGFGVNGQVGLLYRPMTNLQFGLAYRSRTGVHSHGDADGNAGVQLANLGLGGARPDFHYDAEVDTDFPQMVSGGISWQVRPRWRLVGQVDWIDWSDSFDTLPVTLTHGNNASINGVVGANAMEDNIPLHWKDQFVYRFGVEYALLENVLLRAGYKYGRNPVPTDTLTPLTAVITEHTLTAGLGWNVRRFQIDFAYQYDFANPVQIEKSSLRSGEYSNSRIETSLHWLALTLSTKF